MRFLYKSTLVFFIFSGIFLSAFAQEEASHKLYLKDGRIIEGVIIEQKFGESITLRVQDGERITLEEKEVELLIRVEPAQTDTLSSPSPSPSPQYVGYKTYYKNRPISYRKDRSIYNRLTFALGFVRNERNTITVTPTIPGYSMGYRYNQNLNIGVGLALEPYDAGLFAPVFLEVHGDYGKEKRIMPHYFGQIGYAAPLAESWAIEELRGGLYYHLGAGYKFNRRSKIDWTLTGGFKSLSTWQSSRDFLTNGTREGNRIYRRIVIGITMGF